MTTSRLTGDIRIEDLTGGNDPRLALVTFGFGVYPIDVNGQSHDVCPGVVFPGNSVQKHRPKIAFPLDCAPDAPTGGLKSDVDGPFRLVDLDGFSAGFSEDLGLGAATVTRRETTGGHFTSPPPEGVLDFNLIPDVDTFYRGLALSRRWRQSQALQAYVTFGNGVLGSLPDHLTLETVSAWGFNADEEAKHRRKSSLTFHLSDSLPSLKLRFRRLGETKETAYLMVKPLPNSNIVLGVVINGAVDANGEYIASDRLTLNFAHMNAMLDLCESLDRHSVKFDFGRKLEHPPGSPETAARAAIGTFRPVLFGVDISPLLKGPGPSYMSDANCGARKMRVSA